LTVKITRHDLQLQFSDGIGEQLFCVFQPNKSYLKKSYCCLFACMHENNNNATYS